MRDPYYNDNGYSNGYDPNNLGHNSTGGPQYGGPSYGSGNTGQNGGSGGDGGSGRGFDNYNGKVMVMKRKNFVLMIVIILIAAIAISFGGMYLANYISGSSGSGSTSVSGTGYKLEDATGSSMTVQEIDAKVKNSVVEIKTESTQVGGSYGIGEYVTEGAGSGVVIKKNGYIMTNNHVIEGANKITVTVNKKNYTAKVVGTNSENDIAVLKIRATNLTPVTYGNSDKIDVGDMAVIIGNPLGELGGSVTAGIVSAKNREVTLSNQKMSLIQTDASVNPGNSGGGMFNDHGQLIGVVVAKSSGDDVEGLGFAIPVNTAAKIASNIMKGKSDSSSSSYASSGTAFSGMSYQDLTNKEDAQRAGVSKTGIYVGQILTSNAQQAGFQTGDLVYSVNGKKITSFNQLKKIIQSKNPGDKIKYVVVRSSKRVSLSLTLISKEDYEESQGSSGSSGGSGSDSQDGSGGYGSGGSDSSGDYGSGLFDYFFGN